jgi:hypothetical protein
MADVAATFVQMLLDIPEQNGGGIARFGARKGRFDEKAHLVLIARFRQSEFGQFRLVTPPCSLIF